MGRTVSVKLMANVADYVRNVGGNAVTATKQLTGELDKAAKAGKLDRTINATAGLGIGLLGAAGAAVKMSMDFEKSMSSVKAATHASGAEVDQLRQAALRAGKDTSFSATQAADGITELSKAGVSTADVLGGGLKGALDLAAAGQLDVGEAAETAASALTQFKLSGKDVPHVADLLAAAAGKAQGSVHDMGFALNQSGLVAAQFGLSIEDTTGTLAAFASAGLTGSDAGTSFKTMLLALANPAEKTADLMDDVGISAYDASGKFVGITGLADQLKTKLRDLTQAQRDATLAQIFGTDAIRAANILYQQGGAGIQEWINKTNDAGYASSTAAMMTDNLAGDLDRLKGSLETVAIQSGGGTTAGLRKLAQGAGAAVDAFGELPGWVQQSVTVLSGVGGASLLAAAGFLKARGTAKNFMDELRDMGPAGTAAANGLGRVGSVAGKLGLAGAAAVGLYEGFKLFGDWIDHFSAPVARDVDKMTEALQEFATTGKVTGELAKTFGGDLSGLQKQFEQMAKLQDQVKKLSSYPQGVYAGRGGGAAPNAGDLAGAQKALAQLRENTSALDKALAQMATNGGATQARIAFQQLAAAAGINIDELPQYAAAAKSASAANTGLAKGFGDAGANAQTMGDSLEDAAEAGQKLTDVWTQLNGALLSADKANLSAAKAIDGVKEAFKANGKAIEGNSQKALANRIAVGEAAKAAAEAAQAKYEETGSVAQASRKYSEYIGQLRKTLTEAGLNKKQVDALIGSYGKMPPTVATTIKQPGMNDAINKAKTLWDKLKGVDGNWVARVSLPGYADVKDKLLGLMTAQRSLKDASSPQEARRELGRFFAGGGWTGPGSKWDVAGVVHADEFVVSKRARRSLESAFPGLLDFMNRAGSLPEQLVDATPGYAGGGRVTNMPFRETLAKTHIPKDVWSIPGGGGGPGYRWMEQAIRAAFPGLHVISDYRPGAVTLTGNRSYHAVGRAVDYPASRPLAEWINYKYKARTKELITPWNDLNIHNGQRHTYTGAVWNQHNFAGGNAHDHWAMANGGVINEPVFGVGLRSGDTYSLGERGSETVTPGAHTGGRHTTNISLTVNAPVGSHPREIGNTILRYIGDALQGGAEVRVNGQKVF